MRNLLPEEVVAMWLWREEYARGGLGAIEFYARLDKSRKGNVADFLAAIRNADSNLAELEKPADDSRSAHQKLIAIGNEAE